MPQLFCRDLQPGDLMLKMYDKSFSSNVILTAQAVMGAEQADVVHAGIMFDKHFIIEAQGPGINANHMAVQNKDIPYVVYRCRRPDIAQGAGTCAKMMFDIQKLPRTVVHTLNLGLVKLRWKTKGHTMNYNALGAAGSLTNRGGGQTKHAPEMDDLLTDILEGTSHKFFCSQFVIYVYQFVAVQCGLQPEAVFAGSDAKVDPAMLAKILRAHPLFGEAGYMLPGDR